MSGKSGVTVVHEKESREAAPGAKLAFGHRLKTGDDATAVIKYPDGSRVFVDPKTEFEARKSKEGVQENEIHTGSVRAIIEKAKDAEDTKRIRFTIHSKSAVMGVRGTEFTMAFNAATSTAKVHTIEGVVEVAKDRAALMSGAGTPVNAGQFVEADAAGIGAPQPFAGAAAPPAEAAAPAAPAAPAYGLGATPASGADKPEPALDEPKKDEPAHTSGRRSHLFAFQAGASAVKENTTGKTRTTFAVSWNPTMPIPYTGFLWLRGHLGFADQFSLKEQAALLSCTLLQPFFAEIGLGHQNWDHQGRSGGVQLLNAGIILRENGLIDRLFVGRTRLQTSPALDEYRAGLGITF